MRNHAPHASRFVRRLPRPVAALGVLVLATTLFGCPGLNDPAAPNSTLTGTTPNSTDTPLFSSASLN